MSPGRPSARDLFTPTLRACVLWNSKPSLHLSLPTETKPKMTSTTPIDRTRLDAKSCLGSIYKQFRHLPLLFHQQRRILCYCICLPVSHKSQLFSDSIACFISMYIFFGGISYTYSIGTSEADGRNVCSGILFRIPFGIRICS